jgi:beta-glucosidase
MGESRQVRFTLTPRDLSLIDDHGIRRPEPGRFISIGGSQPDVQGIELLGQEALSLVLDLTGEFTTLTY